ncbi:uncharacterized protein EI90DRAFT_3284422 [Cantharellus anzutake]|uniref:uncharacterized protein n=1 Tax=Cantharellus anzutake TaxID=1750568 RepID=UPI0019056110|nr:uncharacterized protein EI90DRAFT_3284422 [Cantharellus anzutake]KAF8343845.1 hypothetical protein EI90DRAFT_3284422 [Cantharellus anzutake]
MTQQCLPFNRRQIIVTATYFAAHLAKASNPDEITQFPMSTPMDVDPKYGAARDQPLNTRIIQAINHYRTTNPGTFGQRLQAARLEPIILLELMLLTYLPTGTEAPDRDTCVGYIEGNPNLWAKLVAAYGCKSFSKLFNLVDMPFLRGLTNQEIGRFPGSLSVYALQSAFEEPYQGETPQLLVNILNDYWRSCERPYSWSLPVIQSSGMGKSRMVSEAALSVFTIPINIREELGDGIQAYPPPDKKFRDYFRGHQMKSDLRLQAEYAIILSLLFTKATALLEKSIFEPGAALAWQWANYLNEGRTDREVGTNRKEFLDSVVDRAMKIRSGLDAEVQKKLVLCIAEMKESCRILVRTISGNDQRTEEVKCVVYFDEAHQLTESILLEMQNRTRRHSPYQNLGKVLSELTEFPVFFVFLSTSSGLQKFAPMCISHPSVRISHGPCPFPPFTELPFDIFVDKVFQSLKCQNKSCSLENMGQTDVMAGFGRGLWYVHHKNSVESGGLPVISLARDKLVAQGDQARMFHSLIAALGVRIGITFDHTTQASMTMESELVESHMRVVYAIPKHCEFMHTGSPSEPILAEAAARHLNYPFDHGGIEQHGPEILAQAFKKGLLAKGEHGELCGRLLVTIAHDVALKRQHSQSRAIGNHPSNPYFHQPVHVLSFLQALFTDDIFHDIILGAHSVTAKADVPTLGTAFAESYIFFSHFALAEDSEMLSAPNLAVALLRGMALQAKDNQNLIDAVIPVHMGPLAASILPKSTSAINLQFKNRKKTGPCHISRQVTIPDEKMPVISIIFELGDEQVGNDGLVAVAEARNCETYGSVDKTHWEDHHYEIVAHGCTSKTFVAVLPAVEPYYQHILADHTIIQDFPRAESRQSLHALQNLKPFFNGAQESAEWSKWLPK